MWSVRATRRKVAVSPCSSHELVVNPKSSCVEPLSQQCAGARLLPYLSLVISKHTTIDAHLVIQKQLAVRMHNTQITSIRMACTSPKGPFNYRIYTSAQPYGDISQNPESWIEVGAGRLSLPQDVGQYGAIPLQLEVTLKLLLSTRVFGDMFPP
jgi:hypothetical protein